MCKAEEMWKQVEAFRRQKMTQREIDEALMEYIGRLEKQRDELLSALERVVDDWVHPFDGMPFEQGEILALDMARDAIASVKGGA